MSLKERVYSVLVVSASDSFNTVASSLLSESHYSPIRFVSDISSAKRAVSDRSYDFVIINAPLPDDIGMRFAIDAGELKGTVVLFLIRSEYHDEIHHRVVEHGIFTLPKPLSKPSMINALNWMASAREKLRRAEKKTLSIEEKMDEIRLVNRAKWILISEKGWDEADAHRFIEKQAMDRCISKKAVAESIISVSHS